jgi:acetyl esterase/lipase
LQQAVTLLEHLLHSENLLPSAITLMGDSAGAHLLLGLILHLGHSNPLVSPLEIAGQFSGAVLISPWVTMGTSAESMQSNKHKDILSATALSYWSQNFLGGTAPDSWNTPLLAPAEYWRDLPVAEILVLYGDDELLRDDILLVCEKLEVRHILSSQGAYQTDAICVGQPCSHNGTEFSWRNSCAHGHESISADQRGLRVREGVCQMDG